MNGTTTKMNQKVSSVLAGVAIALLVAILIVVWMQFGHGVYKPKENYDDDEFRDGSAENNRSIIVTGSWENEEDYPRHQEEESTASDSFELLQSDFIRKKGSKEILERSHLDDLVTKDTEFVKPLKLSPPPLHDHDLIYDQMHNAQDHPALRHHSGHFRHRTAEIWDPHPRYEIEAFGRRLDLELALNGKFVAPNLQVTRMWNNYTQKSLHDPRTLGCFYTGKVKGEENSDVAVSLCNGMTGYIRTSEGNYYIEPVEAFQTATRTKSILHRIKKISHSSSGSSGDGGILNNEITATGDLCETRDRAANEHPSMDDDEHEHLINKRDLRFDYLDASEEVLTGHPPLYYEEKRRTTRNVPWASHHGDIDNEDDSYEYVPRHRITENQEYHIEIMVVADRKMIEYHKTEDDLTHYILTLMSHVALLYKDKTIGNPISLAVVKIILLREMEFKTSTSSEMLNKFCKWQAKYNLHHKHDTALLLTRESICRNLTNQQCQTVGVANVNSMCEHNSSCAIVKDKGLSTSYTIAHELGHVLSMPHDGNHKCSPFNGAEEANSIMSEVLQNGSKPWFWSACSKHYLTEFLQTSRASCLMDTPNNDFITSKFVSVFPGETFEVDRQCELEFGLGYRLCPYVEMPRCGSLWCTYDVDKGCKTQHMPWADGTLCGEQSWCHHGECIVQDRNLLHPIPGGWGDWQEWGSCSRTCGGGVRAAKRACDSPPPENGGAYCMGQSVKYSSCSTQPCEPDTLDFRDLQCSMFDGNPRGIPGLNASVKWIPKYGFNHPDEMCKLYCRVVNTEHVYTLEEKVIDGTKCGLDTFNVCVNGFCKPAGCDNRLDSKATLDECGVCGGDNSECQEISGTYNISRYGYNPVARLPKGSANIYIQQRSYGNVSADQNFLALVDGETGQYILSGNYQISPLKSFIFGGVTVNYSGSENVIEHIKTQENRTLTKDLILQVLSVGKQLPPDITYRYTIRRESAPRYSWQLYDQHWSKCDSICSGKQYLRPLCVDLSTSTHVPDSYCENHQDVNSLVQQKECNTHCKFSWIIASRGQCSSHCGSGQRPIVHKCIKVRLNQDDGEASRAGAGVNERHCLVLPKPPEMEPCQGPCDLTRWDYDEWSECTKTCGGGTQRRNYKCVHVNGQTLSNSQCNEKERITEQVCNNQKCPVWSFDEWSPCSVTCGKGYRKRPYYCHVDGRTYGADACDPARLPVVEEECYERPCTLWATGKWSECNVTCGEGTQGRDVYCSTYDSKIVDESRCAGMLKPNSSKVCIQDKCNELAPYKRESNNIVNDFEDNLTTHPQNLNYRWITGAWTKCTKPCETGTKSRMVICRDIYGEEDEQRCDPHKKPVQSVECNKHACPMWNFGGWSTCDANCEQHRQVSCQNATGHIVTDAECDTNKKPYSTAKCNTDRCIRTATPVNADYYRRHYYNVKENRDKQYKWKMGKWSECSKSCGRGTKTRLVRCVDVVYAVTLVDQYCRHQKKPKTKRPCEKSNCDYMWIENPWSQCSQTCGQGFKYRNVTCHRVLRGGYIDPTPLPDDFYCDINSKPLNRGACTERNCNDLYSWWTGPWSECTQPCGRKGRQTRSVYCVNRAGRKVNNRRLCPIDLKPKRKRKCNNRKCFYGSCKELQRAQQISNNKDYYLMINGRPALVYCYKMDTREPEEFISLKTDQGNFAEMYDKRLREQNSCPSYGQRRDDCNCIPVNQEVSGFTVFWKVRLNITSLRIITDDFTFSRQIKGTRMQYGTAGDCYSDQKGCIQGRFSIDLTDTSFRLSRNVRWIHQGTKASSQIDVQERTVRGRCGGDCGGCLPDPMIGLVVEVT